MSAYAPPFQIGQSYRVKADPSQRGPKDDIEAFIAGEIVIFKNEICNFHDGVRVYYFVSAGHRQNVRRFQTSIAENPDGVWRSFEPTVQPESDTAEIRTLTGISPQGRGTNPRTSHAAASRDESADLTAITRGSASAIRNVNGMIPQVAGSMGYVIGFSVVCAVFLAPMLVLYAFTNLPLWMCLPAGLIAGVLMLTAMLLITIVRQGDE